MNKMVFISSNELKKENLFHLHAQQSIYLICMHKHQSIWYECTTINLFDMHAQQSIYLICMHNNQSIWYACTTINLLSFIIEIIAFQKETEQIVFAS